MSGRVESQAVADATTHIIELLQDEDDGVFDQVLRVVLDVVRSPLGFCGYIDSDGALVCASMTQGVFDARRFDACQVEGKSVRFPQASWGGLWGRVLRERRPLYLNDTHHTPDGHLSIARSLGAPLLYRGDLVGSVHVANRDEDYGDNDAWLLQQIVQPVAPVLHARLARRGALEMWHRRQSEADAVQRKLEEAVTLERQAKAASEQSRRELQTLYQAILDATPAVIYVKQLNGEYQFINRQFEDQFHLRRESVVGQTDLDIFPLIAAQQFRDNDRLVARSNEPLHVREIVQHPDGSEQVYFSVKFPLQDEQGVPHATGGISTNITEQVQAERALAELSRQRDLILDAVGDGVLGIDASGMATFINPVAERLLGWTIDELRTRPLPQWLGTLIEPLDSAGIGADILLEDEHAVFRTKSGEVLPVRFVSRPLRVNDQSIGTVITFRDLRDELRQQADIESRLQSEQRQLETERQLQAVRRLQIELFPGRDPQVPGYEIAGRNDPQLIVSGDFFDYSEQPDGSLVIVVGDSSGHDLSAAVHMVEAHAALHTLLDCGVPLRDLLPRLNATLCRHLTGRFISLFVLRLEPATGRVEFAGAGHDAAIVRADGRIETLPSTGLVLGLDKEALPARFAETVLAPGDLAVLLTDGYYEASNASRQIFGRRRVLDVVRQHREHVAEDVIAALRAAVERFIQPLKPQDDMTAVVIRRWPEPVARMAASMAGDSSASGDPTN